MPRPRRIEVKNGIYHIYNRFVGGYSFFKNANIIRKFKEIFYSAAKYYGINVLIWECMPNHLHAIIKIPDLVLSKFIQKYATEFARYTNKEFNRKGHLFQGRHKTNLIDTDKYLLNVIAYILYNPVRAGIVENPGDYKWSNYDEIINENNNSDYNIIYHYFHKNREKGRLLFKKWIENIDIEKNKKIFLKIRKGQFLMDNVKRKEVLKKINRRSQNKTVKKEKRKTLIKYKYYTSKEIEDMLKNYEPCDIDWKGLWQNKEIFKRHLKWFLLRNYAKLSLIEISIMEKQVRHTTISQALRRINNNKWKRDSIVRVIIKFEGREKL